VQKNPNIEKIAFKVVHLCSRICCTNHNFFIYFLHIYIYRWKFAKYLHGTWSLLNILIIFGIKRKINHFDPYNVLLAITTNIPVLLVTGFVIQDWLLSSNTTW